MDICVVEKRGTKEPGQITDLAWFGSHRNGSCDTASSEWDSTHEWWYQHYHMRFIHAWALRAYNFAKTASALLTVTSRPGSFSAYTILPLSMMAAYLAVRSPMVQPNFFEKSVLESERKSCYVDVSRCTIRNGPYVSISERD
jgi:hypothetical protein